jgi:hypothetical protein
MEILTGSLLKKTSDVRVRMNQRFFQDFHPIPGNHINLRLFSDVRKTNCKVGKIQFSLSMWNYSLRSKV